MVAVDVVAKKMPHFVTICSRCPPDVSVVIGPPNGVAHVVFVVREIYEGALDGVWIRNWRRIRRIVDGCGRRRRQIEGIRGRCG